jgi:REP element-mobilizing transposase RayT
MAKAHTGWTSRGYLPHFDQPDLIQGITFRLADALPVHVVEAWMQDPAVKTDVERRTRIETYLNAGHGACYLRDPRIGKLVEGAFQYFDGERYRLIAWVVMPNHVHAMIEVKQGFPLRSIVQSWKSFTAHKANDILDRKGTFWYADYFDRFIRDERHYSNAVAYIHNNPVKAGLVDDPKRWPFSSARLWR